ncbi:protein INVOLVED IN DE NOVO 2-like [Nymphaea colorata]|nr:protein INVOLVED IN DE NOVO 2-like [Nymphaea colorata]XP_031487531.1 protein INVOLVED IN DE NOVO 2-like [Nymphaea colorata]XP_031487533.1 protein INVOLVED IN DE NOVO 2-like [Nymphaea colorata]XP_031487535.1 protein INVOLVED IN DE NOVO 2-like [Nymphaea colorata]XP_031487536.1 protein INVOLVED IN DE NOVO 2-like [Nymphaea colorata]XP_049934387.1 protein INVOLVED IN DE NOVO 2-like [Nymphaea colorata]XP_049934388.1 protein INVOLVED IN DE NOVO 2-like [Nymphaea colorata]XP_049934389.1 protein IN
MSSGSDDCSDFSEGEIEERVEKLYKELKEKNVFTGSSDGFLRCPYCLGRKKQDYKYKDLLQHATGVGNSNKRLKETAKHRALAKFLQLDFVEKPGPSITPSFPRSAPSSKRFKKDAEEERFVWPWMGIVVNIQAKGKDGKHFATASRLKEEFAWFNPVRAYPLWDYKGFRGTAILEFNKEWSGYHAANSFERSFQVDHHGKKEWIEFQGHGSRMYGWMAREDDYNSVDRCIREHLRKHGDLRTVTELEDEEKRKKDILVDGLKEQIDLKNKDLESSGMRLKEVTYVLEQTKASLEEKESDMARLMDQYNEEMRNSQRRQHALWMEVLQERETCRLELEKEKKELASRQKELLKQEAQNDYEKKKFEDEKKQYAARDADLQAASMEQKKTDENLMKLLEDHKREKEEAHRMVLDMQKKLEGKQNLEVEIEKLKGKIQMVEHMEGGDDSNKIESLRTLLEEKEAELDDLDQLNTTLLAKERITNDELQEARKEIIAGFDELFSNRGHIGVKRMGELDSKAFKEECKKKYPKDYEIKAVEMASSWDASLRDPNWFPFKVVQDGDNCKEIINDDDERLKELKAGCGEGIYEAVVTALKELNEYNASGRYPVKELWNFKAGRKASLKEAAQHLIKSCKLHKRKK